MHSVYDFVVTPKGDRYNNTKKVGGKDLILNTEISNHLYVNRQATVVSVPFIGKTNIKPGDTVVVHHNVFRRWYNIKGIEKNSRSFFDEKTYFITPEQIFLYKRKDNWLCPNGYCFVKPIRSKDKFNIDTEEPLKGVVKYTDGTVKEGDVVGFKPGSKFEFVVDGERLYRVLSHFITIKYEYKGNEEEYNPSWAQSS